MSFAEWETELLERITLRQAIKRLPERHRRILVAYCRHGETFREIGEHEGISLERVRQLYLRACIILRQRTREPPLPKQPDRPPGFDVKAFLEHHQFLIEQREQRARDEIEWAKRREEIARQQAEYERQRERAALAEARQRQWQEIRRAAYVPPPPRPPKPRPPPLPVEQWELDFQAWARARYPTMDLEFTRRFDRLALEYRARTMRRSMREQWLWENGIGDLSDY